MDAYVAHLQARGLRPATITAYTGWLRRLPADPDTLSAAEIEAWIGAHDWAPATRAKCVQALRDYYRWRGSDVADGLRPGRVPRPTPDPCPEDVYAAALAAASGDAYWKLRLAADTGLRRSELAAVHPDDLRDLAAGPVLRVDGKGGVVRWVPLPSDLAAWLRLQRGFVFASGSGHMAPGSVGRWYVKHLGLHPHSLRHRYATLAYRERHDIASVRVLLGHASVATTQVYISVADADLAASAAGAWDDAQPLRLVR